MSAGTKGRRTASGYVALVLGTVGALIAIATAAGLIWTAMTTNNLVDAAVAPVTNTVDRLDARLTATSDAVSSATTSGQLRAQTQGVLDLAVSADESLTALSTNPLARLVPVDVSPVTGAVGKVADSARAAQEAIGTGAAEAPVADAAKSAVTTQLSAARTQLDGVRTQVNDLTSQLKTWVRLGALGGVLLCLWGLWAQIALARSGRRTV